MRYLLLLLLASCGLAREPAFHTENGWTVYVQDDVVVDRAALEEEMNAAISIFFAAARLDGEAYSFTEKQLKSLSAAPVIISVHGGLVPCRGASGLRRDAKCYGVTDYYDIDVQITNLCLAGSALLHEMTHVLDTDTGGDGDPMHTKVGVLWGLPGLNYTANWYACRYLCSDAPFCTTVN